MPGSSVTMLGSSVTISDLLVNLTWRLFILSADAFLLMLFLKLDVTVFEAFLRQIFTPRLQIDNESDAVSRVFP